MAAPTSYVRFQTVMMAMRQARPDIKILMVANDVLYGIDARRDVSMSADNDNRLLHLGGDEPQE